MTKHIGPIIAWIIIAGILLYAFRHVPELRDGVMYARHAIDSQGLPDAIKGLLK